MRTMVRDRQQPPVTPVQLRPITLPERRVPERARYRRLRRADAGIALLLGCYDLFAGSRLLHTNDATVQPWHQLWPILFAVAGVTCLWFAYCAMVPRSRHMTSALSWSGALSITAYASRALILLISSIHNTTGYQTPKLQLGFATWLVLALVTGYIWLHVFKPGVEMSKLPTRGDPPRTEG